MRHCRRIADSDFAPADDAERFFEHRPAGGVK
jgi:hypothetical protein